MIFPKFDMPITKMIFVVGTKLYLYDYEKEKLLIETPCFVGKNGFSIMRKAGDFTTPVGLFKILYAFGTEDLKLNNIEYRQIKSTSYYCDDEKSKYYNEWIESDTPIIGEHLIDYPTEYHYGVTLDFNMNPKIKGKGSSIFLHCNGKNKYTAGCIAIKDVLMYKLLSLIDTKTYILIIPDKDYLSEYLLD
jgi:L,D-peptidoglycan transpeptidase YkuD (ErfK/YbiS/YcfS/YnhG family)